MTNASDRRPIAARNLPRVIALSEWLIRKRASPDGISLAGMAAATLAGCAFALTRDWPEGARALWLLGALLVQARLMANLLDGMVAIGRKIASPLGELFNEVPDRVSDTAVLVGLGWACDHVALGFAAALAAMATAYIRAVGRGLGQPSDFSGPMAKQQRMAVVTALGVACGVLPAAWTDGMPAFALWVIAIFAAATAVVRLAHVAKRLKR